MATIASLTLGLTIPFSMVIFGDSIDSFTDRALDLCSLNLTSLAELYCPPGVVLTPTNFYTASVYELFLFKLQYLIESIF